MSQFSDLCDAVKLLSKRYDVDDKIALFVRSATLRAHRSDFYWRDRVESQIYWTSDVTLVDINLDTYLPRLRNVSYVRYWDPATGFLGKHLEPIDPVNVVDEYDYEKTDRYYGAGDVLKVKFSVPTRGVQIGYFISPTIAPDASFSSWIAIEFPDIIVQGALAMLYNSTGKQEEAKQINQMVGYEASPRQAGPTLLDQLKMYALEERGR